ncbi:MAG: hypothetical protein ABF641_04290 [Acetobacter sp.]
MATSLRNDLFFCKTLKINKVLQEVLASLSSGKAPRARMRATRQYLACPTSEPLGVAVVSGDIHFELARFSAAAQQETPEQSGVS